MEPEHDGDVRGEAPGTVHETNQEFSIRVTTALASLEQAELSREQLLVLCAGLVATTTLLQEQLEAERADVSAAIRALEAHGNCDTRLGRLAALAMIPARLEPLLIAAAVQTRKAQGALDRDLRRANGRLGAPRQSFGDEELLELRSSWIEGQGKERGWIKNAARILNVTERTISARFKQRNNRK